MNGYKNITHKLMIAEGRERVIRICITGGIACGKSLVGKQLFEYGIAVRDADDICHELIVRKGPVYRKIVSAFGKRIINIDGQINRKVLGRLIFSDPVKRRKLNSIIHPEVYKEIEKWISSIAYRSISGRKREHLPYLPAVAVIIPLLYEVGWQAAWDRVICVSAPLSIQIERLRNKGVSEQDAFARLNAQLKVEEKMRRADYVIFNTGTLKELNFQVRKSVQDLIKYKPK